MQWQWDSNNQTMLKVRTQRHQGKQYYGWKTFDAILLTILFPCRLHDGGISAILWYNRLMQICPDGNYCHAFGVITYIHFAVVELRFVSFWFCVFELWQVPMDFNLWSFRAASTWYSSFSHVRAISFIYHISMLLVVIAPFLLMSEPRHGGPETEPPNCAN